MLELVACMLVVDDALLVRCLVLLAESVCSAGEE